MADEAEWKRRFALFSLARLSGMIIFIAGLVIATSDLVQTGGSLVLGVALMLFGLADAFVAPKLMRQHWRRIDGEKQERQRSR